MALMIDIQTRITQMLDDFSKKSRGIKEVFSNNSDYSDIFYWRSGYESAMQDILLLLSDFESRRELPNQSSSEK